jgi:hypothetical protein
MDLTQLKLPIALVIAIIAHINNAKDGMHSEF